MSRSSRSERQKGQTEQNERRTRKPLERILLTAARVLTLHRYFLLIGCCEENNDLKNG